jgi:hypothetical protein
MHLDRRLDRSLNRRLRRFVTSRTDGRAFRLRNYLAEACQYLNLYLRQHKKMARADPHLFGPHSHRYYLDTVQLDWEEKEIVASLRKVYGPPRPGDPPPGPDVWTERYFLNPQWKHFQKWFREHYGPD